MIMTVQKISDYQYMFCEHKDGKINETPVNEIFGKGEFLAAFIGKDREAIREAFKVVFEDDFA